MSDGLVERLAAKQAAKFGVPLAEARRADARWWLNAIAEELEANRMTLPTNEYAIGEYYGWGAASVWLREQAEER